MEKIELKTQKRDLLGKKVKQLRSKNQIPIVLYGHGIKSQSLIVGFKDFNKVLQKAGTSALVDLEIDGKSEGKVLIQEVQNHPVTDLPLHADLYKIKMTEKIETEIPLEIIGESIAVTQLEGNLILPKTHLEIKCLPGDLIPKIEVDISVLNTFDDTIHVKDLKLPETIEILDDPEETIALVEAPRSEEELKEMETEAAADQEKAQIEEMEKTAEAEKAEEGEEKVEEGEEKQEENK